VAAPRQRTALAALFTVLTLAFAALAAGSAWGAGGSVRRWLVAAAATAIAAWFAGLAWQLGRHH
jgi:formate hydrogenlyase subunit 4